MPIQFNSRPQCTACGVEKRETNYWWLLIAGCMGGDIRIAEWDQQLAYVADACSCGEACTHTLLSRWFASRSFEVAEQKPAPTVERILTTLEMKGTHD